MAKDTKQLVLQAFLILASRDEPINLVNISKLSGVTRPAIVANFGKNTIQGIIDYLFDVIDGDIQTAIKEHDIDEISPEIWANLVLPNLYKYHNELRILFTSPFNFKYCFTHLEKINEQYWLWAKERFDNIAKVNNLTPTITGKDLFEYWNRCLNSIYILWLSSEIPESPKIFKKKYLFLLRNSMISLFFSEFENND